MLAGFQGSPPGLPNVAAEEKNSLMHSRTGKHIPESGESTTARFEDAGVPAWRRLDGLALILSCWV